MHHMIQLLSVLRTEGDVKNTHVILNKKSVQKNRVMSRILMLYRTSQLLLQLTATFKSLKRVKSESGNVRKKLHQPMKTPCAYQIGKDTFSTEDSTIQRSLRASNTSINKKKWKPTFTLIRNDSTISAMLPS